MLRRASSTNFAALQAADHPAEEASNMELIIIRHGHAEALAYRDAERALTRKGKDAVRAVGTALQTLGARPQCIIASPYVRAQQTALILAETFALELGSPPLEISSEELLTPESDVEALLHALPTLEKDDGQMLLVSHMPLVGDILGRLLCASDHASLPLSTACAVWLETAHITGRNAHLLTALSPLIATRLRQSMMQAKPQQETR